MKNTNKNYLKLLIIIFCTVLITVICSNLYRNYEGSKSNSSYLKNKFSTIYYQDISSYLTELSSTSLLYVSYIGNKDIYNLERKIGKLINQNGIEELFTYLDATEEINENKTIFGFNKKVNIVENKTIKFPAIIYFKESEPIDYVDSSEGLLDIGKISQLIEKYELN